MKARQTNRVFALCGALLTLGACSTGKELSVKVLHEGDGRVDGKPGASTQVLADMTAYTEELAAYFIDAPAGVDFSTSQVLLIDMGTQASGGHHVVVTSAMQTASTAFVDVEFVQPGANCMVTMAATRPHQFVLIPSTRPIEVQLSDATNNC